MVKALIAQGMTIMSLFNVFMWSQELVGKMGVFPMAASVTVHGGSGFKDAITKILIQNFIPSLYGFLA